MHPEKCAHDLGVPPQTQDRRCRAGVRSEEAKIVISEVPEIPPQPCDEEITALENLLRTHGGWMSATGILINRNVIPDEGAKRRLRATAAESKWIISGQQGYKHLQQATPDEVKHFVNQMSSQARNMDRRAEAIEQNYRKVYQTA
jgi:hypothetical protein